MKNPNHTEVELKYDATDVTPELFDKAIGGLYLKGIRQSLSGQLDSFYELVGGNVLRFRRNPDGTGVKELTIKKRTSASSTLERVEVDLKITNPEDVPAFMAAIDAKPLLTLSKDYILYHLDYPLLWSDYPLLWSDHEQRPHNEQKCSVEVCLYTAEAGPITKRFIEVEVHKGQLSVEDSMAVVGTVGGMLKAQFAKSGVNIGEPLNVSLFETFRNSLKGILRKGSQQ